MSKIISSDKISDYNSWNKPSVGGAEKKKGLSTARKKPAISVALLKKLEQLKKEAYDEGFAKGKVDGEKAGRESYDVNSKHLSQIIRMLDKPLLALDDEVVDELTALAISIAKQIIRRELKIDPGQVVATVRETLSYLPVSARNIRVYLNPEDVLLVKKAIEPGTGSDRIELLEDPVLSRGGCRIVTDSASIDVSIESRLAAIITQVMGGERTGDEHNSKDSA